jgi:FHA domain-containing protein
MASLADVERLLERVFERSTARLFRTHVQVVQLERRVERAMERARTTHGGRTSVPGRYRVRLHPDDLHDLAPAAGDASILAARLADAALAFARAHAYHVPARPSVLVASDASLQRGQVEVDVATEAGSLEASAPAGVAPYPGLAASGFVFATTGPSMGGATSPARSPVVPTSAPAVDAALAAPAAEGIRGDGTQTLVYRRPAPPATRAVLRVLAPGGTERTVEVDGPLTIGRARDNGLVLADPRVSRVHARLQSRRGALVYTDLGSTNGSRVNGIRVDEIALGMGDRVQVGDTVLVVELLPG